MSSIQLQILNQLKGIAPKNAKSLINSWGNPKTFKNALDIYGGTHYCYSQEFNTNSDFLNVKNGVINLRTGELLPHSPEYKFTYILNVEYNPLAKSDSINKFFTDIIPNPDTRRVLLRFLGYCLTGNTNAHKSLLIYGRGRNGKSVLNKLVYALLGDYSTYLDESALRKSRFISKGKATPELTNLQYKRLAIIDELPEDYEVDIMLFKRITAGVPINIRGIYQKQITITPYNKLIFSGNHTLNFLDEPAMMNRLLIIQFPVDFSENKNVNLVKELIKDLPALLSLLVQEAIQYYKEGLLESIETILEREIYSNQLNPIEDFITDNCTLCKSGRIRRKELLEQIRCNCNIEKNITDKHLTTMILNIKGITIYKLDGKLTFKGIAWK